ncbi:MAG: hypothetical protein OXP73_08315 [Chloroflexota bacterium]|nr:hypothetical protein [Chloroflexota bacterium]
MLWQNGGTESAIGCLHHALPCKTNLTNLSASRFNQLAQANKHIAQMPWHHTGLLELAPREVEQVNDAQRAARLAVKGVGYSAGTAFILVFWVIPAVVTALMVLGWLWGLLGG